MRNYVLINFAMEIKIVLFGQLTEIAGPNITMNNINNTDELVQELNKKYPAFSDVKYMMAVNKKMIVANTVLTTNCTVALLPPFSGG